jgi:hypothetical protein
MYHKNDKSNFLEKKLCYEKLPKFEQYFELVSRIVKLILTPDNRQKHNMEVAQTFLIIYLNKTIRLPW